MPEYPTHALTRFAGSVPPVFRLSFHRLQTSRRNLYLKFSSTSSSDFHISTSSPIPSEHLRPSAVSESAERGTNDESVSSTMSACCCVLTYSDKSSFALTVRFASFQQMRLWSLVIAKE